MNKTPLLTIDYRQENDELWSVRQVYPKNPFLLNL